MSDTLSRDEAFRNLKELSGPIQANAENARRYRLKVAGHVLADHINDAEIRAEWNRIVREVG